MISTLEDLLRERRAWRASGVSVVLANGCFDLLHPGHVELLEAARGCGEVLIVALNSDRSVRENKGSGRPVIPEAERAETLLALETVDRVVLYEEPTPRRVIEAIIPDVLAKGADWGPGEIVGSEVVEAAGGRVVRIPLVPGHSTTAMLEAVRRS